MRLKWSSIYLSLWPCIEATCECGFRVPDGQSQDLSTFMYALETNFVSMKLIDADKDWIRQEFNVTAQAGRGRYGKTFTPDNVVATHGKGLQLQVDSQLKFNSVLAAEVDTSRLDLLWGSYRAGMRLTAIPGTCAAFFWVSE
ncbi:hypothetical protein VHEMI01493 [[Torrubiella] hemipterigena]|uniref:Uncharacterized protein n=1 Tax=[Torrubiella] hemipterigena TaxID=1531966 RepID=A0A0A1T4X3_9HYPO|nr:hypothetical protein VHEMI01493 [[Torrubiella] hemipterigena]